MTMRVVVLLLVLSGISFSLAGPFAATNLLVEYLPSPVFGIDVAQPRFSWQLAHSDRGQYQTSYTLTVYVKSSPNPSVVWNTGRVDSDQINQLVYAGSPLKSDTSYYWQVQWWDSNGVAAPVSAPAYFDTGFYNASEWLGTWIGGQNQLRTEFELPQTAITRARLYICGMGYYVARINGDRVGDNVLGPWTQYESRSLYDVYDIGTLLLPGANAIAVALGKGFYGHSSVNIGPVALITQISITFADGSHQWVAISGKNWNVIQGPVVSDNVYVGESYDARLETPGWDRAGYNDSAWKPAPAPTILPPGKLQAHLLYPQKKIESYSPVNYWEPTPGVYVFDFGQNMAGWSQIRVIGPPNTTITIQHSEMVNPITGELENLYWDAPMTDNFTLAGTGEWEYFEPQFVFHGFQYVQITGYPGVPPAETIQAFFIHSSLPEIGTFICSNPVINYVDHMTRAAAISNFQSIPSDCPTREKRGWLGDAQVSAETQMQYWEMAAAYTKFVQDIDDSQKKINNGNLGDTAPWYNWGATPADPAWGTAFTLIWYWSFIYYNDTRILNTHYNSVKWYVNTLTSQADPHTGLLAWSRYGDWCAVAEPGGNCVYNSSVVTSFYYIYQLDILVEVSTLLGYENDTAYYTKLATNARAAFTPAYYNPSSYTYDAGYQTYQILPLVADLVPGNQIDHVVNYLLNDVINTNNNHLTVGVVGAKYLLSTLTELGRADVAFAVTSQSDYPSWGNFQTQGGTTLWENWQSTDEIAYGSRNHIMFGGQATWYYQELAGIKMTEGTVAWSDITIHPVLVYDKNLSYATASLQTHRGQIYASWNRASLLCGSSFEGSSVILQCPNNGIITTIDFASFGTPNGVCGTFTINASCNANDTMQYVVQNCVGKNNCQIQASTTIFKDPCFGVFKRLYIQYSCTNTFPYNLQTTIPVNSMANVFVSKFALSSVVIQEGGKVVWQNSTFHRGVPGIIGAFNTETDVIFRVGSGSYAFTVSGNPGTVQCVSYKEGETFKAACPADHVISRLTFAHFGVGEPVGTCGDLQLKPETCSIGSGKHVMEKRCLHKNSCEFDVQAEIFGDAGHRICGDGVHTIHAEYMCSKP